MIAVLPLTAIELNHRPFALLTTYAHRLAVPVSKRGNPGTDLVLPPCWTLLTVPIFWLACLVRVAKVFDGPPRSLGSRRPLGIAKEFATF